MRNPSSRAAKLSSKSIAKPIARRKHYLAILAVSQLAVANQVYAGPEGGQVVGGMGTINQSGNSTSINQQSNRMAIDWDSFNLGSNERVEFIQPGSSSIALNRILSHEGSEIHGRIDANGHVFLVNPNGVFFGEGSQINVGGMIASGLTIDPTDFMNGDFTFSAMEGTDGKVVNAGIVNAATGGSIALLGKQVRNDGLITANLGAVNLAAGKEAVVTFESSGLVGVRISKEVLQDEIGLDAALINNGEINAQGGRILLSASTSQDIFSQAVNRGDMGAASSVVMHEDGSFTLGAGADVVNAGSLNVSAANAAGHVVVLGENITSSGSVRADSQDATAGNIELHSAHTTLLTENSLTSARAETGSLGGQIKVLGHHVSLFDSTVVDVSGALSGGDVLVGGDYQGKNSLIRNANSTFVAENAAIYADALVDGDGGRVIVWADDVARFRGGTYGRGAGEGSGGFAEVSGKEYLRFTGHADLSGPGATGTLLLDPETITIGIGDADESALPTIGFDSTDETISAETVTYLLGSNNVVLQATDYVTVAKDINAGGRAGSLTLDAGGGITISANVNLGGGDMFFTAGHYDCGAANCSGTDGGRSFSLLSETSISTTGNISIFAADNATIAGTIGDSSNPQSVNIRAGNDITVSGSINASANSDPSLPTIRLSAGDSDLSTVPAITVATGVHTPTGNLTTSGLLSTAGGHVQLDAAGAVSVGASITTSGGNFTAGSAARPVGSFHSSGGSINTGTGATAGDVKIHAVNDVTLGELLVGFTTTPDTDDTQKNPVGRGGNVEVHAAAGDVVLDHAFDYNQTESNHSTLAYAHGIGGTDSVKFELNAGGSIVINQRIYDSSTSSSSWFDTLDVELNADTDGSGIGDVELNADVFTAGGTFTATGFGFGQVSGTISTNHGRVDDDYTTVSTSTTGGHINISATGDVSLSELVTKTGENNGNLSISAGGAVTQDANALTIEGDTVFNGGGDITLQSVANVFKGSISFIDAGDVKLKDSHADGITLGNSSVESLSLAAHGDITQLVSTAADPVRLSVTNTTSLTAEQHQIDLTNANNDFGTLKVLSNVSSLAINDIDGLVLGDVNTTGVTGQQGGEITITAGGSLTTGTLTANGGTASSGTSGSDGGDVTLAAGGNVTAKAISTVGSGGAANGGGSSVLHGGAGGDVSIASTTGNMTLESITSDGGDGTNKDGNGGTAGAITLASADTGVISLQGDLFARGGIPDGSGSSQGGTIQLNGNVQLAGSTTVDAGIKNDESGTHGNVTFAGTLNNAAGISHNLAVQGATMQFAGAVGSASSPLGDMNLAASGGIAFGAVVDTSTALLGVDTPNNITANSLDATSENGFVAGDITTVSGGAGAAGNVVVDAGTGSVKIDNIHTYGLGGENGGVVTLSGRALTLNSINTNAGGIVADTNSQTAGAIEITATASSNTDPATIRINGDIQSRHGDGSDRVAELVLDNGGGYTQQGDTNSVTFAGSDFVNGHARVTGSGDDDTIEVSNTESDWSIAGEGDESSIQSANGSGGTISFTAMETAVGSSFDDTFEVTASNATMMLQGGDPSALDTASGVVGDTLIGASGANAWVIDGDNASDNTLNATLRFEGFENLTGNAGNDTFTFRNGGSVTGVIDGGSSSGNVLDYSKVVGNVTIDLGSDDLNGVTRIQILKGNGASSTIGVVSGDNSWTIGDVEGTGSFDGSHNIDGTNDGAVSATANRAFSGTVKFIDFANLVGGTGDDTFRVVDSGVVEGSIRGGGGVNTLQGRGDDSTWNLSTGGYSIDLESGDTYVAEFSGINNLQGGSGADIFSVNTAFAGDIKGGAGDDEFNVGADGSADSIDGETGFNTLTGRNAHNIWTLAQLGASQISQYDSILNTATVYVGSFSNINTLQGGSGVDVFNVNSAFTGSINGGAGSDAFVFGLNGSATAIHGEGGSDTLHGRNAPNTWRVTGSNAGEVEHTVNGSYVDSFAGIEHLAGGSDNDTFVLSNNASVDGSIDGGGGNGIDHLDISANSDPYRVEIGITLADALNVLKMAKITGNGNAGSELIVTSGANDWTVDGADIGNVNDIEFSGFANLTGGTGIDNFVFAKLDSEITGTINGGGGAGINSLTGRNQNTDWEITSNNEGYLAVTETKTKYLNKFESIHELQGSDANDIFNFASTGSVTSADGGIGDNTANLAAIIGAFDLTLGAANEFGVSNVSTIVGNHHAGTVLGISGGNNTWTIDAVDAGTLVSDDLKIISGPLKFSGFANVTGGVGDDDFILSGDSAAITGLIDGGGGLGTNSLTGRNQDTDWHIDGAYSGTLTAPDGDPATDGYVHFTSIQELYGNGVAGAPGAADTFILYDAGSFTSADGGSGSNTVDLSRKSASFTLTLGGSEIFGVSNISSVVGNDLAGTVLGISGGNNTWTVTSENAGTVVSDNPSVLAGTMTFSGFASLAGAGGNDKFVMDGASVTGSVAGNGGDNRLEISSGDNAWNLTARYAGTLNSFDFTGIQTLAGGTGIDILTGRNQNNDWQITAAGGGLVAEAVDAPNDAIGFSGMDHLMGNAGNDDFTLAGGSITGIIDGAGGINSLAMPAGDNSWALAGRHRGTVNTTDFVEIQMLLGGTGSDTLTARNQNNSWIVDGAGSGNVAAAVATPNDSVGFRGMNNLIGNAGADSFTFNGGSISGNLAGSDGNDTFNIASGSVSGDVNGGNGNDSINVEVSAGASGQANIYGDAGTDTVTVTGASAGYNAVHALAVAGAGELRYSKGSDTYTLAYSGIATVNDDLVADLLRVDGTAADDTFTLGDNSYSLNSFATVNFDNKRNLLIAASAKDAVAINGAIAIDGRFTLQNAAVSVGNNGQVSANTLLLDGTANVGSGAQRLRTNITDLAVRNARGDVYLQEQNGLNVTEFVTNSRFDVALLSGDFTSKLGLASAGDFSVSTLGGDILLQHDNALAGDLRLSATETISLVNTPATNLATVQAQTLNIQSGGAINGSGPVVVGGLTSLESDGNIRLDHAANDFNSVTVASAKHLTLVDSSALTLTGVSADGNVSVSAEGLVANGAINAASVTLDAKQGTAVLANNITATNEVVVSAQGIDLAGRVSASQINFDGKGSSVALNGSLNTTGGTIDVTGRGIIQNAEITSGGTTTLSSSSDITQNADITSDGNIRVAANGNIGMNADSTSRGEEVSYSAGGTMTLGHIEASSGLIIDAGNSLNMHGNLLSSSNDIVVNSGNLTMSNHASMNADSGSVSVNSSGSITTTTVSTATDISLKAANTLAANDSLNAADGIITLSVGNDITLTGDLSAGAGIQLSSSAGNIQQSSALDGGAGEISVSADGDITMGSNATSHASSIRYSGQNIAISGLSGELVELTAGSAVSDNNGDAVNITAQRLKIDAQSGIGSNDPIETMVSELSLSNNTGATAITNGMAVTVDGLRSNGDVALINTSGDVHLDSSDGHLYSGAASDARVAGGTVDANYNIGTLLIDVADGDLLATAPANVKDPIIAARNATLVTRRGAIGHAARPLILHVKDNLVLVSALPSWTHYAFGSEPANVDDSQSLSGDLTDLLAAGNEQLVEVEGLEEIDPAIFTNVRNYSFDDISILLPRDQLYYYDEDDDY